MADKGIEEFDRENLSKTIQFWRDSLSQHRLLMGLSAITLVESTIRCLERYQKGLKDANSKNTL